MAKKTEVTLDLQVEAVAPETTVTTEVQTEPVVDRFVELADQLRVFIQNLPVGERMVSFALIQEMQELHEKR